MWGESVIRFKSSSLNVSQITQGFTVDSIIFCHFVISLHPFTFRSFIFILETVHAKHKAGSTLEAICDVTFTDKVSHK